MPCPIWPCPTWYFLTRAQSDRAQPGIFSLCPIMPCPTWYFLARAQSGRAQFGIFELVPNHVMPNGHDMVHTNQYYHTIEIHQ